MTKLEQNQICQGLPIQSFLTLPMQRITRLPLLVDAVCHRMDPSSQEYENATRTLQNLQKVCKTRSAGPEKVLLTEHLMETI